MAPKSNPEVPFLSKIPGLKALFSQNKKPIPWKKEYKLDLFKPRLKFQKDKK